MCLPLLLSRGPVTPVMAVVTVPLDSLSHPVDVNHPTDVNSLSHRLALTIGLVSRPHPTADLTHIKPASHLLRSTAVLHSTTAMVMANVGLSDVLVLTATGRIHDLTTVHDRRTLALLTGVHVRLLMLIVDPTPALCPAAVLDVLFVVPLVPPLRQSRFPNFIPPRIG